MTPRDLPAGGRAGIGFDAHRLEAGRPLKLGGLAFPDEPRGLAGHSDGDVALHAVIDALLGAAHLGDIGVLFPAHDPQWAGADSADLLRMAWDRITAAGMRPTGVDLTIVAEAPAIAPVRGRMEARIAALLDLEPASISVKGSTSDGLGMTGGAGIAAYAVAVVVADGNAEDDPGR